MDAFLIFIHTLLAEHENGHLCCPSFCVSGSARHSTVIEGKKSTFYSSWNGKIDFFFHIHTSIEETAHRECLKRRGRRWLDEYLVSLIRIGQMSLVHRQRSQVETALSLRQSKANCSRLFLPKRLLIGPVKFWLPFPPQCSSLILLQTAGGFFFQGNSLQILELNITVCLPKHIYIFI